MITSLKARLEQYQGSWKPIEWEGNLFILVQHPTLDGSLVVTNGLSNNEMKVPEKYAAERRIELCFFIPKHWDLDVWVHGVSPWILETLAKIAKHIDKGNWVLNGHTFNIPELPNGKFKDAGFHSLLLLPCREAKIFMEPLLANGSEIYIKALMPVFKDEKEYKDARGLVKSLNKFIDKGISEKLDEFRATSVRHRFLFWV